MSHRFGDLLSQHLHRKHGLSQAKLAAGILQDPSIIGKMCKGQRLSGPQARERVLAIIGWLRAQGALETVAEANALLDAAGMAGLQEDELAELALPQQLCAACFPRGAGAPITGYAYKSARPSDQLCRAHGASWPKRGRCWQPLVC